MRRGRRGSFPAALFFFVSIWLPWIGSSAGSGAAAQSPPEVAATPEAGRGAALRTRGPAPVGYEVVEFDVWRWASPAGRIPPEPGFGDFFVRQLSRVRSDLGARRPRVPLVVATAHRTAFVDVIRSYGADPPSEATVAVAFPLLDVMVLDSERLRVGRLWEYPETVTHEIVHLVLGEGGAGVPRWYHEGLAQWLSGRRLDRSSVNQLALLASRQELVPLADLSRFMTASHRAESILYQQSLSVVEAVDRMHGAAVHSRILAGLRDGLEFPAAYQGATDRSLDSDEDRWHRELASQFSWLDTVLLEITLFRLLALVVVVAFVVETLRRRKRLQRMAESERGESADGDEESSEPARNPHHS